MAGRGLLGRRGSALAVFVITVGLVGVLAFNGLSVRTDGPFVPGQQTRVTFPIRPDVTGTWGTVLPTNPSDTPLVLESVVPINPSDGIIVDAVRTSRPDDSGVAVGTLDTFPPPGVETAQVEGAILPPAGEPSPHIQVLLSVALAPGYDLGTIDGLRVRYRAGGTLYEVTLPDALELVSATS